MGDLSVNALPAELKVALNGDVGSVSISTNEADSIFDGQLNTASKTDSTNAPQKAESSPQAADTSFTPSVNGFDSVKLPANAEPQKEVNGIKIYATGSKSEIKINKSGDQTTIRLESTGQVIKINSNEMQPKGAQIVYNGQTMAVKNLSNAQVQGSLDDKNEKIYTNNQMLAVGCKNCTFKTGDYSSDAGKVSRSRDNLVLDNCKGAKVSTGQNNNIVGINGTNADVQYNGSAGINKDYTFLAFDDASKLTCSKNTTINQKNHHNYLIRNAIKPEDVEKARERYANSGETYKTDLDDLLAEIALDGQRGEVSRRVFD